MSEHLPAPSLAATAFRAAIEREGGLDLFDAALTIGRIADPALDLGVARVALDALAGAVADELSHDGDLDRLAALNRALFEHRGFRGNHEQYGDPRNGFLHETLARRTGLPITISLVYLAAGRRAGLTLEGVGFPGHFLVRAGEPPDRHVYLDPFNGGREIAREALAALLRRQGGDPDRQLDLFLAAVTPRQILARMLLNVKSMYRDRRELARCRDAVELLLVLTPWAAAEWRDYGLLSVYLDAPAPARTALAHYLELAPDAADADRIRVRLETLRHEGNDGERPRSRED
ncbi:MAG TPA: transglutaminase-like domain-containing protein [Dehalococcoidia bacterium]|nr:transglutaminase-like domain-containing protein [Dehalococcoidia bacterium]